jgi:four helix bundle protein
MAFKFENLKVWQLSVDFSGEIHDVTREFPKEELFILTSQIKRAADSISLNIAEGSTGQTNPEFKRFFGIAIRSGIEVVGCLHLAKRRKLIREEAFQKQYENCSVLIRMIQALRNKIT